MGLGLYSIHNLSLTLLTHLTIYNPTRVKDTKGVHGNVNTTMVETNTLQVSQISSEFERLLMPFNIITLSATSENKMV